MIFWSVEFIRINIRTGACFGFDKDPWEGKIIFDNGLQYTLKFFEKIPSHKSSCSTFVKSVKGFPPNLRCNACFNEW